MDYSQSAIILVGVCGIVLLIGVLRSKLEWVLNFMIRSIGGVVTIYLFNLFLVKQNIAAEIGINFLSVLTSGILGFPGVILLFGIKFYEML